MFKRLLLVLAILTLTFISTTAFAETKFHIRPEAGYGVFLEDDQVITSAGLPNYGFVRLPGFVFPGVRGTTTGLHVEFSPAKEVQGVQYALSTYTRFPIAENIYTGAIIRIATGDDQSSGFDVRATPIVGMKLASTTRFNVSLEVEFLDNDRPVKAGLVFGWQ